MKKIENFEIEVDNQIFNVRYIEENQTCFITPHMGADFDTKRIVDALKKQKCIIKSTNLKINDSLPQKAFNSKADIKQGYMVTFLDKIN